MSLRTQDCTHYESFNQWWNLIKYIYSNTLLKYNFEVLHVSVHMLCCFIRLLTYI